MNNQNTPWESDKINVFDVVIIDKEGKELFTILNNDRMRFILKAVNNHDKLVEALDKLINTSVDGSGYHFTVWKEAKKLLTELKSYR